MLEHHNSRFCLPPVSGIFDFQEEVYYSEPTWEGGLLLEEREAKELWGNAKVDARLLPPKKAQKNFWRRGEATKNASCPREGLREGGKARGWEGAQRNGWQSRDCNGFHGSQENAEEVVVGGEKGNISWGRQGGHHPANTDEDVMVHIIL